MSTISINKIFLDVMENSKNRNNCLLHESEASRLVKEFGTSVNITRQVNNSNIVLVCDKQELFDLYFKFVNDKINDAVDTATINLVIAKFDLIATQEKGRNREKEYFLKSTNTCDLAILKDLKFEDFKVSVNTHITRNRQAIAHSIANLELG